MNDWGPTRSLVDLGRRRGVPSFAKVEGAQDFADVDTGRERRPYQRADVVLAQGSYDVGSLPRANVHVVGNHRLQRLWAGPERKSWNDPALVVINSNFTYGVLPEVRERWLAQAVNAVRAEGCVPIVSQHPADPPLRTPAHVTETPISDLLASTADLLISRFSTVPLEAMANGVPFIYFNPHQERVPMFREPEDAFPIADTTESLRRSIGEALRWRGRYRARCATFFERKIDTAIRSPGERTADVIEEHLTRVS